MMFKQNLCFVLLFILFQATRAVDDDLEEVLNSVFGTAPSTTEAECECVPYYQCLNDTINTIGEGLIDIRADGDECETSYLDICCKLSSINKVTTAPPITQAPFEKIVHCGHHNPNGIGFRFLGDDETQYAEFPWVVAILRSPMLAIAGKPAEYSYKCGGALINSKVVITAAHCVNNKKDKFLVRAGEWDTQTTRELYPHQNRNVKTVIIHPEFYSGGLYNDLALLILDEPFELAENINIVCLPHQNETAEDNSRCYVTGWGTDHFEKEGEKRAILKKLELPIVNRAVCENNMRKTRLGRSFQLDSSFVCAGGELNKDTCKGDGGSPLVCPIPGEVNKLQIVGLVSWGVGCGQLNVQGLYTNVPLFANWIDETIKKHV